MRFASSIASRSAGSASFRRSAAARTCANACTTSAAAERLNEAEPGLREAVELANRSLEGLGQTRRVGDAVVLVVRPQEAVAAVQALGQANADFFAAVADYNRAQFRLYRALGHPAQCLAGAVPAAPLGANPFPGPAPEPDPGTEVAPLPAIIPSVIPPP